MIPKVIHYCWFGGSKLPEAYRQYMETWKRYMPEYEIIEWNESNFDVTQNDYCREAYEARKWAFVSDYARLKIIYDYGGIYLDTDVEVLKPLTPLVSEGVGFIGFQNAEEANTGLGFAADKGNACIETMLNTYNYRHFRRENGTFDMTPCPVANTVALKRHGLKTGRIESRRIQRLDQINVLPVEYLNPLNGDTKKLRVTSNSYTIHHYAATWLNSDYQKRQRIKKLIPDWALVLRTEIISRRDVRRMENELQSRKQ